MSGYYGPNCSSKCRYPNYGLACQLSCNCSEDHCHYIMGCRKTGCPPGYYEINCSRSCRFPNYGIRCQQECVCSKELCHHITGCRAISTTDRSTEIVSTYKMETWNQDLHNQNCSSIKVEDRIFKRLQFLIIFSLMTVIMDIDLCEKQFSFEEQRMEEHDDDGSEDIKCLIEEIFGGNDDDDEEEEDNIYQHD
uniref:Protein draper-like n=1 Tax=Crassostrea virginica TaxID=6565 RepID=A0A8B8AVR2_CRAVI|nr:protein draper-like [Crassostrea virginica]